MSVIVTLEARAKPGQAASLRETFLAILPDTRAYAGCESLEFVVNQDDADVVMLWEVWKDRQSYETYLQWRVERGDVEKLAGILAEPASIRYFDTVRSY